MCPVYVLYAVRCVVSICLHAARVCVCVVVLRVARMCCYGLWPACVVTACGPHVLLRLVFRDQMEAVVSEAHEAGLSLGKISVGALLQVRACGVMISSE